jgi:hypothetical protein
VQPDAHAFFGDAQYAGGIAGADLVDFAKREDNPVRLRQQAQRLRQCYAQLAIDGLLLGIAAARGECQVVYCSGVVQVIELAQPAAAAKDGECLMNHDARHPGEEARTSGELRQVREGVKVAFLDRILHFGVVTQDGIKRGLQPLMVAQDEIRVQSCFAP